MLFWLLWLLGLGACGARTPPSSIFQVPGAPPHTYQLSLRYFGDGVVCPTHVVWLWGGADGFSRTPVCSCGRGPCSRIVAQHTFRDLRPRRVLATVYSAREHRLAEAELFIAP